MEVADARRRRPEQPAAFDRQRVVRLGSQLGRRADRQVVAQHREAHAAGDARQQERARPGGDDLHRVNRHTDRGLAGSCGTCTPGSRSCRSRRAYGASHARVPPAKPSERQLAPPSAAPSQTSVAVRHCTGPQPLTPSPEPPAQLRLHEAVYEPSRPSPHTIASLAGTGSGRRVRDGVAARPREPLRRGRAGRQGEQQHEGRSVHRPKVRPREVAAGALAVTAHRMRRTKSAARSTSQPSGLAAPTLALQELLAGAAEAGAGAGAAEAGAGVAAAVGVVDAGGGAGSATQYRPVQQAWSVGQAPSTHGSRRTLAS